MPKQSKPGPRLAMVAGTLTSKLDIISSLKAKSEQ